MNKQVISAADRIIKKIDKMPMFNHRAGAFLMNDYQYFGNDVIAIRTKNYIPVYKDLQKNVEPPPYEKFIDDASSNCGEVLDLPSLPELKEYIKTKKAEKVKPVLWDFGENLPQVNAEFLKDVIIIMGNCEAIASKHKTITSAIYFKNDSTEAILMPMRK